MPTFNAIPQYTKTPTYRVNIFWDYLKNALEDYNSGGVLQLDPPFQRAHVWTHLQQVAYVEYILRGGAGARDIFFNQADFMRGFKAPMYLVDGKQRVESVRCFMRDNLRVFDRYFYSDFTDRLPLHADFVFLVNDLPTYADVLQWYIDLNAGGVAHTTEEIDRVRKLLERECMK